MLAHGASIPHTILLNLHEADSHNLTSQRGFGCNEFYP